jgi:hypothetical protein
MLLPRSKKRALSAIIASIIITAVCIVVAVVFGFYFSGAVSEFTSIETLEIISAYSELNGSDWIITVKMKNTGSKTCSLIQVLVNDIPIDNYGSPHVVDEWSTNMTQQQVVRSGETVLIKIYLDPDKPGVVLSQGSTIELTIQSAGGADYPRLLTLG